MRISKTIQDIAGILQDIAGITLKNPGFQDVSVVSRIQLYNRGISIGFQKLSDRLGNQL